MSVRRSVTVKAPWSWVLLLTLAIGMWTVIFAVVGVLVHVARWVI